MTDISQFKKLIEHKKCKEGIIESSKTFAYVIDGENGISSELGFVPNMISQSDYFLIDNNKLLFIELTDVKDAIKECIFNEQFLRLESATFAELMRKKPEKAISIINGKIWSEVLAEFKNKWMGSIAVLERYCRKIDYPYNFEYGMMIIIKNNTDPMQLDALKMRLKGMINDLELCTTNKTENVLLARSKKSA